MRNKMGRALRGGRATVETIEHRLMLAAHIVGSSTAYATIQAAVNAAVAGATITVDAGTYAEQVTVGKSLTIKGAQAGVDATSRVGGSSGAESIVSGAVSGGVHSCGFYITASDVTLDGFTVQGETNTSGTTGAGIVTAPKTSGAHILNNIIQKNVAGMFLANYSSSDGAVIQHNYFASNNNTGENSGRGIYTSGTISGGIFTNVTIDSNTFVNNYGDDGIEAACSFQASNPNQQSNITLTNNVMSGNGKATLFFNTTGVVISNNTITGCIDTGSGALRFEGNNHNVTIQNNTLHDNTSMAVAVDAKGTPGDSSGFVIKSNNFYNNNTSSSPKISVVFSKSTYTGTFDVRNNWWGSASGPSIDGPGTGDGVTAASLQVNGNVESWKVVAGGGELLSPWLSTPYSTTPTAPTAPASLGATLISPSQINLAWTDTAAGNESGFILQRSTDGVNFTQIATTGAGVTTYADTTGLVVGNTYSYRVAATNSVGTSGYSNIASATVVSTVTTYISDIPWVSATIGYGSIGIDKTVGGRTISLRGATYAKGIGTHAVSQIVYNLAGQYSSFLSDVGVDDEDNAKGLGSVDFQVIGDGKVLFDSGVVTNNSAVVHINVSVAGVQKLTLLATNGVAGSIDYDHADWAGAKLISSSSSAAPSTSDVPQAPVASQFAIVSLPSTATAGTASAFTLQAQDSSGNIVSGYTGTVHFSSSDVAAGLPADYTFTAADAGSAAFSVTFKTAGNRTITATDTASSGMSITSATVAVKASTATRVAISAPTSVTAKAAFTFTLTAYDAFGNIATGYLGSIHFTSTDTGGSLPTDYTFTSADAGVHTFSATFKTKGTQSLTAKDKNNSSLAGSASTTVK